MNRQAVSLTSIRALYKDFHSPFSIEGADRPSVSIVRPRRAVDISMPRAVAGLSQCPAIDNYEQSEVALIYLPDVLVSHTGAVVYQGKYLIAETVEGHPTQNGLIDESGQIFVDARDCPEDSGIVLITNKFGTFNYSIFLAEMVPAAYLSSLNPDLTGLTCPIHFPEFMSETAKADRLNLLEAVGVSRDRLINRSVGWMRYKGIVLCKVNDRYKNFRISQLAPFVASALKVRFATSEFSTARRMYVSRQNAPSRKLENLDSLKNEVLDRHGFALVDLDRSSVEEQVNLFSKADIVLAEHGAALANTMFMRPSACVIEIFPEPMIGRFMYRVMAHGFKLNYFFGSMPVPEGWRWNVDNLNAHASVYNELVGRAVAFADS